MRLFALAALTFVASATLPAVGQEVMKLNTASPSKVGDAASYQIGYSVGMQLAGNGLTPAELMQADFVKGFMHALSGTDPAVTPEQIQAAMKALDAKITARMKALAEKNASTAKAFLEKNKTADGVQTTPSGLQYKVLKSGSGAAPTDKSEVTVHYEGKLINGTVFDSSIKREEPTSFPVTGVIRGWTEALLRMKVGDKYQLFIPPELAYGLQGRPPAIGPNELLIFEVELLEVK
ncbi:MAG: FKBP-type peptidyl-prolyl cis-trans isomerase [Aureliella sp.]